MPSQRAVPVAPHEHEGVTPVFQDLPGIERVVSLGTGVDARTPPGHALHPTWAPQHREVPHRQVFPTRPDPHRAPHEQEEVVAPAPIVERNAPRVGGRLNGHPPQPASPSPYDASPVRVPNGGQHGMKFAPLHPRPSRRATQEPPHVDPATPPSYRQVLTPPDAGLPPQAPPPQQIFAPPAGGYQAPPPQPAGHAAARHALPVGPPTPAPPPLIPNQLPAGRPATSPTYMLDPMHVAGGHVPPAPPPSPPRDLGGAGAPTPASSPPRGLESPVFEPGYVGRESYEALPPPPPDSDPHPPDDPRPPWERDRIPEHWAAASPPPPPPPVVSEPGANVVALKAAPPAAGGVLPEYKVVIRRDPVAGLGCKLDALILIGVKGGSAADHAGATMYIGMRCTHIDGVFIGSDVDLLSALKRAGTTLTMHFCRTEDVKYFDPASPHLGQAPPGSPGRAGVGLPKGAPPARARADPSPEREPLPARLYHSPEGHGMPARSALAARSFVIPPVTVSPPGGRAPPGRTDATDALHGRERSKAVLARHGLWSKDEGAGQATAQDYGPGVGDGHLTRTAALAYEGHERL
eukprot:TRINITY_DN1089_c0_g3_i3.p2 TRINITY_DN1089_c0_g3~~TRINITY_DN1089_c0_g3_i3.p2  ORF type:complete len:577 (+),score=100.00 TRINITY_DN1089_c0_g3_i3:98-1828(+)